MSQKNIIISIPRGDVGLDAEPSKAVFVLEATDMQTAEARLFEVATVTPHKANELLALFNNAFLIAGKGLVQARYQHVKAEQAVSKRRAVIVTDILPTKLQEKGLATARSPLGSEDIRAAFIEQDEDFIALTNRKDQIRAVVELLDLKKKAFENAYSSVKKILGENNYTATNRDLSGGHGDDPIEAGDNITPRPHGWGAPKN